MPSSDYIPADDAGLAAFATQFQNGLTGAEAGVGLLPADAMAVASAAATFTDALQSHNEATVSARTSRATKDLRRDELVTALRSLSRRVQAFPGTTDAERAALGLPSPDTTPTAVAAPTSQPILFVGTANRLQHVVEFRDSLTPLSKAKPAGALGCEIYRKIGGTPPSAVDQCEFLGLDSSSPYTADYGAESGGLMVHYLARWATRSGLTGPTSDLISATVVA